VKLNLYNNHISGTLPSLDSLTRVEAFSIEDNEINGTIPSSISKLESLTSLTLSNNDLEGTLPNGISKLTKLYELKIDGNDISGTVPRLLLTKMDNIAIVNMSYNSFEGRLPILPNNLRRKSQIGYVLDFHDNQFSGAIPAELLNVNITSLDLSHNKLTGTIPDQLKNLKDLYVIKLNDNDGLTGGCFPFEPEYFHPIDKCDLSNISWRCSCTYKPVPFCYPDGVTKCH